MHRLFASLIAPLIEAVEPRAIVETGAGAGRLTRRIAEAPAARTARLHAIDPAPTFAPRLIDELGERLEIHRERAVSALGRIGAVDLAVLDGDPNWFSVQSELKMLADAATRAGRPAPLVIVHNVHWPFGRRDGYHDPDAIPVAQRHELSDLGLVPGRREPLAEGLRLTPHCATRDFEPRSGVLTAIEDFVAGSALDWTVLEIPGFHGAAVLVEARLLEQRPAIDGVLDDLRTPRFLGSQVRRAEAARLEVEVELAALAAEAPVEVEQQEAEPQPEPALDEELELEPEPVLEEPEPEPEPEAAPAPQAPDLTEPLRALEAERLTTLTELAEHRARREALEWRLGQLEGEVTARDTRLDALTAERDVQREGLIEARVRLEQATQRLEAEEAATSGLRERVAELERASDSRARELHEVSERERLAQGRLAHREDALQAAGAESAKLRKELEGLRAELGRARDLLDEIAAQIERAGSSRWARFGRRMRIIGRALTFRGSSTPEDPYLLAKATAERGLPSPPPAAHSAEPEEAGREPSELDLRRRG